jgi:hypothetical protein
LITAHASLPAWSESLRHAAAARFHHGTVWIDGRLEGLAPWQIVVYTAVVVLLTIWLYHQLLSVADDIREAGEYAVKPMAAGMLLHKQLLVRSCLQIVLGQCVLQSSWFAAGVVQSALEVLKKLPIIRGIMEKEQEKMLVCTHSLSC